MKQTNLTTNQILKFLFNEGFFCWRNSVGATGSSYTTKTGDTKTRYMAYGKPGSPDIMAICPPDGRFLGVEVKTGKDKLRPVQLGFIATAEKMGATVLVVKTYEDFLTKFATYGHRSTTSSANFS